MGNRKFNSLSEAIREGAKKSCKAKGTFGEMVEDQVCTCAMGAAYLAVTGGRFPEMGNGVTDTVEQKLGINLEARIPYPNRPERTDRAYMVIYNMNDGPSPDQFSIALNPADREYTREEIANYVEKFEHLFVKQG